MSMCWQFKTQHDKNNTEMYVKYKNKTNSNSSTMVILHIEFWSQRQEWSWLWMGKSQEFFANKFLFLFEDTNVSLCQL